MSRGASLMTRAKAWVSVEDGAAHVRDASDSVYRWIEERRSPAPKIGRVSKFKPSKVDTWVRAGGATGNAISKFEGRLQAGQQSLTRNRSQMEAVRTANAALSEALADSARKAHVLGRISLYLESMPDVPDTRDHEAQAESLRAQCKRLEEELSDERVQEQLASIASRLSQKLTRWQSSSSTRPRTVERMSPREG
ncbi:MAG: hypothetical protein ACOY0T_12885 [Myxococcota bacterium]